jgi:hypothetical protein
LCGGCDVYSGSLLDYEPLDTGLCLPDAAELVAVFDGRTAYFYAYCHIGFIASVSGSATKSGKFIEK